MNFSMKICVSLILLFITACSSKQNIPNGNCTIEEASSVLNLFSKGTAKTCLYDTYTEHEITYFHENGAIYKVGNIRINDKHEIFIHGLFTHYDDKGNITIDSNYVNGIKMYSKQYSNNRLDYESYIVGNDETSILSYFSDNNTLMKKYTNLNKGLEIQKEFFDDTEVTEYKNDEISISYYYSDNNTLLRSSTYLNDELETQKKYYNDTEVIYEYKNNKIVSGYCNIKSANTIIPLSANDIIDDNYKKLCLIDDLNIGRVE